MVHTFYHARDLENVSIEVWGVQRKAARIKGETKTNKCHPWAVGWIIGISKAYVHGRGVHHAPDLDLLSGSFSTAMHKTLTKALDKHTPYETMYNVKSDLVDLCVFCAIIGPSGKLKEPSTPHVGCGLGYKDQWGTCNMCAMYIHGGISIEQGGWK